MADHIDLSSAVALARSEKTILVRALPIEGNAAATDASYDMLMELSSLAEAKTAATNISDRYVLEVPTKFSHALVFVLRWLDRFYQASDQEYLAQIAYYIATQTDFPFNNFSVIMKLEILSICDILQLKGDLARQQILRSELYDLIKAGAEATRCLDFIILVNTTMAITEPSMARIANNMFVNQFYNVDCQFHAALNAVKAISELIPELETKLRARKSRLNRQKARGKGSHGPSRELEFVRQAKGSTAIFRDEMAGWHRRDELDHEYC